MQAKPLERRRGVPLRAAFVMTASLSLACGRTHAEDPDPHTTHNPPPPPPPPKLDAAPEADEAGGAIAAPGTSTAVVAEEPITWSNHPRLLNTKDPRGRMIKYSWHGDGCFVYGEPKGPLPPGGEPPAIPVDCPAAMRDAAFKNCRGGELRATDSADPSCACFVTGNPPPPPERVECPKSQ